jgi:hypothetical protein
MASGVQKKLLTKSIKGTLHVAVLRSQMGFNGNRPLRLSSFVDSVVGKAKLYNFLKAAKFDKISRQYFDHQLEIIQQNYGSVTSDEDFARQSFFCSSFIVACYIVVCIIGPTAQVAYLPEAFSPGHLYRDPTFGWLLGFLLPPGAAVPEDDPLLVHTTSWIDCQDERWW